MNGSIPVRRLVVIGVLTVAWCGLWGSASIANIASGVAVSTGLVWSTRGAEPVRSVRPLALLRLVGLVVVDLVRSTVSVATEVLTPTDHTDELVIAAEIPEAGRPHVLFLTVAITLTPGTAVVDVDRDRRIMTLHLLHADRRDEPIEQLRSLAELAGEALPGYVPPSEVTTP